MNVHTTAEELFTTRLPHGRISATFWPSPQLSAGVGVVMEALYPMKTYRRSRSRRKKSITKIGSIVTCKTTAGSFKSESEVDAELVVSGIYVNDSNGDSNNSSEPVQGSSGAEVGSLVAFTAVSTTIRNNATSLLNDGTKQAGTATMSVSAHSVLVCSAEQPTKQSVDANTSSSTTHPSKTVPLISSTSSTVNKAGIPTICLSPPPVTKTDSNIWFRSRSPAAEIAAANTAIFQQARQNNFSSENTSRGLPSAQTHSRTSKSRKSSSESDDISSLLSSRPVSLGSLVVRTHNRNKGSKPWIPFSVEELDEAPSEMPRRQHNNIPRGPVGYYHASAVMGHHPYRNSPMMHPATNYYAYSHTSPNRVPYWSRGRGQQLHQGHQGPMGTLGHSSQNYLQDYQQDYQQPLSANVPHHDSRPSVIPPIREPPMLPMEFVTPEAGPRVMVPEDMTPTKHEEKQSLRALQYNMTEANDLQAGDCTPNPMCDPFKEAQSNPQTPLGSGNGYYQEIAGPGTIYDQENYHIDHSYVMLSPSMIRENGNIHYPADGPGPTQYSSIAAMYSETAIVGTAVEKFREKKEMMIASTSQSSQSPTSVRPPVSRQIPGNITPPRLDYRGRPDANLSEIARYLENMPADSQYTRTWNPVRNSYEVNGRVVNDTSPLPPKFRQISQVTLRQDAAPTKGEATPQAQRTPNNGQQQGDLEELFLASTSMPLIYTSPHGLTKVSSAFAVAFGDAVGNDRPFTKTTTSQRSRFNFKFAPPGLPIPPGLQQFPCYKTPSEREYPVSRLVQSNIWFHTDKRGEDIFRERIVEMAREEAEHQEAAKIPLRLGERPGMAEAGTVVVGNVLANLHAYTLDGSNQEKGFANFRSAPEHCYEHTHDGSRSFFDSDPLTGVQRLPTPYHLLPKDLLFANEEARG
ncbi:hypothetical protein PABG_07195 [Paracoccidioides brasiliensis Pb03]|nr:hypothetical protein PABG_07195 [Paracoccidioides brasiliensis Pb03]